MAKSRESAIVLIMRAVAGLTGTENLLRAYQIAGAAISDLRNIHTGSEVATAWRPCNLTGFIPRGGRTGAPETTVDDKGQSNLVAQRAIFDATHPHTTESVRIAAKVAVDALEALHKVLCAEGSLCDAFTPPTTPTTKASTKATTKSKKRISATVS